MLPSVDFGSLSFTSKAVVGGAKFSFTVTSGLNSGLYAIWDGGMQPCGVPYVCFYICLFSKWYEVWIVFRVLFFQIHSFSFCSAVCVGGRPRLGRFWLWYSGVCLTHERALGMNRAAGSLENA